MRKPVAARIFHFSICIFHFTFGETPHGTPNEKWKMRNAK
jgi:hypothetical protein